MSANHNSYAHRKWSLTVRRFWKRCVCCTSLEDGEAHHKKKAADYPKLRFVLNNGIRLCRACHEYYHVIICGGFDKPCPEGSLEYFLAKFSTSRRRDYKRAKKYRKKMGIK